MRKNCLWAQELTFGILLPTGANPGRGFRISPFERKSFAFKRINCKPKGWSIRHQARNAFHTLTWNIKEKARVEMNSNSGGGHIRPRPELDEVLKWFGARTP